MKRQQINKSPPLTISYKTGFERNKRTIALKYFNKGFPSEGRKTIEGKKLLFQKYFHHILK